MHKTVVLNVVGLTPRLLRAGLPKLSAWADGGHVSQIKPAFPAVTCTAQADYLTGYYPERHGVVGNGWYSRENCEIRFWKQSNKLVQAPKIWDAARTIDPAFTCANLFWWFNMYSTVDYAVTPRPIYRADGRKLPDIYTTPADLRGALQSELGTFPLFDFWGPKAGIGSTRWIARSARLVEERFNPTLTLVYLPHLDYNLQRVGPGDPSTRVDLAQIDDVAVDLIQFYQSRSARVVVVSEYGLVDVSRPIHVNRVLREHGLIAVREEIGGELLDPGASVAFAVADHQVSHVYLNEPSRESEVRRTLEEIPGVAQVLGRQELAGSRLQHARCGDFVLVASPDAWFTYYYWTDDRHAPDFARTVDIHHKPGYDPVELILDPSIQVPALKVGWKLAKKAMGFRMLMDVIPLDATLVKGSHGRPGDWSDEGPLFITQQKTLVNNGQIRSVDVYSILLKHLTG
jgi:predicted AlkP superfamily pyrophosphatase or phosphodiesterase